MKSETNKAIKKFIVLWLFCFILIVLVNIGEIVTISNGKGNIDAIRELYNIWKIILLTQVVFQVIFGLIVYKIVASNYMEDVCKKSFKKFIIIFYSIILLLSLCIYGIEIYVHSNNINYARENPNHTQSSGRWVPTNSPVKNISVNDEKIEHYYDIREEKEMIAFESIIVFPSIISMAGILTLNYFDGKRYKEQNKEEKEE